MLAPCCCSPHCTTVRQIAAVRPPSVCTRPGGVRHEAGACQSGTADEGVPVCHSPLGEVLMQPRANVGERGGGGGCEGGGGGLGLHCAAAAAQKSRTGGAHSKIVDKLPDAACTVVASRANPADVHPP